MLVLNRQLATKVEFVVCRIFILRHTCVPSLFYRPVKAFLLFKLFNFQTFNCDVGHTDDTIKTRLSSITAHIRVKQNACATFHQLNIKNTAHKSLWWSSHNYSEVWFIIRIIHDPRHMQE